MEVISEECGDSPKQVQRYLKLTRLIPELLEKVDDETMGFTIKILNPESIDQAEKMMSNTAGVEAIKWWTLQWITSLTTMS